MQPAEIRASSAVGGYCGEWNWPPADVADGDPNTIWRAAVAPTPTAPAWLDYIYSEPLTASAIFLATDKDGGVRTVPCKLPTTASPSRPTSSGKWARARRSESSFPKSKAKVFRLVVQSVYTPDVRLAEMSILRKGDKPLHASRHQVVVVQVGQSRLLGLAQARARSVMEEEYAEDGASDCRARK